MGRELKSGFVFSLDAFVAFSLILVSIQSLLVISAIPKAYYPGLLQADNLAQDTLQTISIANCTSSIAGCNGAPTILDWASNDVVAGTSFYHADPIVNVTDSLIPPPYSYGYYFYNYSSQSWVQLYNASAMDSSDNPHFGIPFHRVQASAQILVMGYAIQPTVPESPYCNVYCHGWQGNTTQVGGINSSPSDCVNLPCSNSITDTYETGDFNVGLLRLVVWG